MKTPSIAIPASDIYRTFTHTLCGEVVTRDESTGNLALLTPCCGGAATGGTDGVVCKGCHQPVADRYGMGGDTLDHLEAMIAAAGCPVPGHCSTEVAFRLSLEADWVTSR